MKVIVGVLTQQNPTERRAVCENTWFCRLLQHDNILPVFLVGSKLPQNTLYGNTLRLTCADNYTSLGFKTKCFAQWALTQEFDYLFKCDDDTFIATDRFVEFDPQGKDYIGVDPVDHINPKFASGGAGYWLSRKAAQIVADMDVAQIAQKYGIQTYSEDLLVYHALKDKGITFTQDKRFQAWNQPHRHPHASNEIITCHYIKPSEMCRMDAMMQEIKSLKPYGYMDRGNHRRFGHVLKTRFQVEWMGGWGKNNGPILLQESVSVIGDWPHKEALRLNKPTFTYLQRLHGFKNFQFAVPPYDLDYIPLVQSHNPLNRRNDALYVFGLKNYGFPSGKVLGIAEYTDTYSYRYELQKMKGIVPLTSVGPSLLEKLQAQNQHKFTIACENMIAEGWHTEKLVDCFLSDSVPIYIGGNLPPFLEECVCRVDNLEPSAAEAQIQRYLSMGDAEYMQKMNLIRELRFSHLFYEMFAYQTLFDKANLHIDTKTILSDGSTYL